MKLAAWDDTAHPPSRRVAAGSAAAGVMALSNHAFVQTLRGQVSRFTEQQLRPEQRPVEAGPGYGRRKQLDEAQRSRLVAMLERAEAGALSRSASAPVRVAQPPPPRPRPRPAPAPPF